jgi:putative methionine-R-sulfoxide reductase with GAF domain
MDGPPRDYALIETQIRAEARPKSRDECMQALVNWLWPPLHQVGVSWIGFYLDHPSEPDDRRLVLGPCRDKPACSPIGLHGVCGQALLSRQVRIVTDVRDLGESYIACDPRDRSEIVVPLIDGSGVCWGVLDLDSWQPNAFDATDAVGLGSVLIASGLAEHEAN